MNVVDDGGETASLSVLAHMNNRGMLQHLSAKDRSTALHLLGIVPDDEEQLASQTKAADRKATPSKLLARIMDQPSTGKIEPVDASA